MSDKEAGTMLMSLNSDIPTHVKFINNSREKARAWWLNFSGHPVSYGDIQPGSSMKMNTFLSHPWIFRTSENCGKLLVNRQEVYFPSPTEYEEGYPIYLDVIITSPVYSLQEYSTMFIRKNVKTEDIDKLEIPDCLKKDLNKTRNIMKELDILNSSLRAMQRGTK